MFNFNQIYLIQPRLVWFSFYLYGLCFLYLVEEGPGPLLLDLSSCSQSFPRFIWSFLTIYFCGLLVCIGHCTYLYIIIISFDNKKKGIDGIGMQDIVEICQSSAKY